jgi:hypothetical protein
LEAELFAHTTLKRVFLSWYSIHKLPNRISRVIPDKTAPLRLMLLCEDALREVIAANVTSGDSHRKTDWRSWRRSTITFENFPPAVKQLTFALYCCGKLPYR